ncbi:prolyl oligopeptidase family serine peptidase [bacterium]|nr:prolyl oligopeptidase family serine peptidase [bacterium]
MKPLKSTSLLFALVSFFVFALFPSDQVKEEFKIYQTSKEITVDGNLIDWKGIEGIPIQLNPEAQVVESNEDIRVMGWFTYDTQKFYAAVEARDDEMAFSQRGWRYGDGLYLTFLDPSKGHVSTRFHTFGFSRKGKENRKVLVNRNGEYFPDRKLDELDLKIVPYSKKNTLVYEIAIPWEYVQPLKPFFKDQWGINLIYVDKDEGKRRTILQLYPDKNYDTEQTDQRKGALASFITHIPSEPEFQSLMNGLHFYDDETILLRTAVNSPQKMSGWELRFIMTSGKKDINISKDIHLQEGMNHFEFRLPEDKYSTDDYVISVGAVSPQEALQYNQTHTFYILNREDEEKWEEQLAEFKKMEVYEKSETFRKSLPTLKIRFQWVKEYMKEAPPYADFKRLKNWNEEINFLMRKLKKGEPALFPQGNIGRLAHKSSLDGTLQPYSLYVPTKYRKEKSIPLLVTLHGSGVDEQQSVYQMARGFYRSSSGVKTIPMIIMAPKARGLSDWYLGKSGKEVMECIQHVQSLYNIDKERIVLDGFSMGGYGAWRLGVLHSQTFRAVMVRSGAIEPPPHLDGKSVIDLLDKWGKTPVLIVHGKKDKTVSIEKVRQVVKKLKKQGIPHRYIQVEDAAHGDYDRWGEMIQWINQVLNVRRMNIRR